MLYSKADYTRYVWMVLSPQVDSDCVYIYMTDKEGSKTCNSSLVDFAATRI